MDNYVYVVVYIFEWLKSPAINRSFIKLLKYKKRLLYYIFLKLTIPLIIRISHSKVFSSYPKTVLWGRNSCNHISKACVQMIQAQVYGTTKIALKKVEYHQLQLQSIVLISSTMPLLFFANAYTWTNRYLNHLDLSYTKNWRLISFVINIISKVTK